jgi:hypothetical protein
MSDLKMRGEIKPFCPIHHWRMTCDSGSGKVSLSYRCSYKNCTVRHTPSEGYFETGKEAGNGAFLAQVQAISCDHDRDHHPCIVGYAKESRGNQTEEWRHWQCLTEKCDFSLTQKLSPMESTSLRSKRQKSPQREYAFAER